LARSRLLVARVVTTSVATLITAPIAAIVVVTFQPPAPAAAAWGRRSTG
jgi:hypothetical protein